MIKELLVATGNIGKLREFEEILEGVVERVLSPVDVHGLPEVIEDGETFAENAVKKAKSAAMAFGKPVIADDSGLEVDSLDGRPGVYSARYSGEGASDAANNAKLVKEMEGLKESERTATFRCVISYCLPDGKCLNFEGELKGIILDEPRGTGGFGYDPLFLVPEYGLTFAQLPAQIKNRISHRGRALANLKNYLMSV